MKVYLSKAHIFHSIYFVFQLSTMFENVLNKYIQYLWKVRILHPEHLFCVPIMYNMWKSTK